MDFRITFLNWKIKKKQLLETYFMPLETEQIGRFYIP